MGNTAAGRRSGLRTVRPAVGAVIFGAATIFLLGLVAGLVASPSWGEVLGLVLAGPLALLFAKDGLSYIRNR